MRDIAFTGVFSVLLLAAITRPWLGVLIWTWIDYMNPHRLCYGFVKFAPVSLASAAVTVAAAVFVRERKSFPFTRETVLLLLLIAWMTITSWFALNQEAVWGEWDRTIKVQAMIIATLVLMRDPFRINLLVWTMALSIAFYGVKGGLFAIMTGGSSRVRGPELSFIEDNNDIAMVLVVILPLLRYLQLRSERHWVRLGLSAGICLTILAVIATYSRAGMLALAATMLFLVLKSRRRVLFTGLLLISTLGVLHFIPDAWFERMSTIDDYQQDGSAQGRLNAWGFAWNVTKDRPITGGGFRIFRPRFFPLYAPNPHDYHEAHNIFLKILAEHGAPGFTFYMLLILFAWRSATWIRRASNILPETAWMGDLAGMIQVSFVGYIVGGVFSNLLYFGLLFQLIAVVVLCKVMLREKLALAMSEADAEASAPDGRPAPAFA
jgi:probable O-glycosylation ligase (exosortase A-associated)